MWEVDVSTKSDIGYLYVQSNALVDRSRQNGSFSKLWYCKSPNYFKSRIYPRYLEGRSTLTLESVKSIGSCRYTSTLYFATCSRCKIIFVTQRSAWPAHYSIDRLKNRLRCWNSKWAVYICRQNHRMARRCSPESGPSIPLIGCWCSIRFWRQKRTTVRKLNVAEPAYFPQLLKLCSEFFPGYSLVRQTSWGVDSPACDHLTYISKNKP